MISGLTLLAIKNEEFIATEDVILTGAIQTLLRKGLIDKNNKLTLKGEELVKSINSTEEVQTKKLALYDGFEDWWEIYPATNGFTYKNVRFAGIQSKRIKKSDCKNEFAKLIVSGFTKEQIIEATKVHIETAKELSYKHKLRENQLTFVPNSLRYLKEKCFEPYINLVQSQKPSSNAVDI